MDEKDKEPGKLEQLQNNLYSNEYETPENPPRAQFEKPKIDVGRAWQHAEPITFHPTSHHAPASSLFKKILIASGIFFVLAAGIAAYVFFWGINIVSTSKVDLTFLGPVSIGAGQELDYEIVIENKNNAPLVKAVLYIDYPDGTKMTTDLTKDLTNEKIEIGEILQNDNARRTIRAVLYGEQNIPKQIRAVLEYSVKNSNATYRKEKTVDVMLSSAPVNVIISGPTEAASGVTVEFAVEVVSNSTSELRNLLLKAEYPFGFAFSTAAPSPDFSPDTWVIPVLKAGERKRFTVQGRVEGQEHDERTVRFHVGLQNPDNEKQIATLFLTKLQSVAVRRPLVTTDLRLNNSAAEPYIITTAGDVSGKLRLVNNLKTQLLDAEVRITLTGSVLDTKSPWGDQGIYRAADRTILWNKNTYSALATIDPGAELGFDFGFNTLPESALGGIKNGSITANVTVTGKEIVSGSDEPRIVNQTISRQVKFQTTASVLARTYYASGPFKNSGPIPPKVDTKTTYTIAWTIINSTNPLIGAEIRATLPVYANWRGVVSPATENENVIWDAERREVVWRVGEVKAAGTAAARVVYFQVEVQPANTHTGQAPVIVNTGRLTAIDTFTNLPVDITMNPLTTATPQDTKVKDTSGIVIR